MSDITREQILSMEAGFVLNGLIAKHVFGYRKIGRRLSYSSRISDAWSVVEKIKEKYDVELLVMSNSIECRIIWNVEPFVTVEAKTVPLAICRASLLAVMNQ